MIGQRRVQVGDGYLRHVALEATLGRVDRAGLDPDLVLVRPESWHDRQFASWTRGRALRLAVGIVTGQAGQATVAFRCNIG